jgi:hypothetical protein
MMAMLQPLGIEKGKPFAPDERQRTILEDGARVGELFAQATAFNGRAKGAQYRPDAQWRYVITFDPSQESKYFTQLDERADYFYQAVTTSKGMTTKTPGVGQGLSRRVSRQKRAGAERQQELCAARAGESARQTVLVSDCVRHGPTCVDRQRQGHRGQVVAAGSGEERRR